MDFLTLLCNPFFYKMSQFFGDVTFFKHNVTLENSLLLYLL